MPQELILSTAAVVTAVGIIIGSLIAIYRLARRIGDAIGVDKNGRTIADRLDRVEHQLWENGGSSLADRVNSIESHAIKTSAEIDLIKKFVLSSGNTTENPVVSIKKTRVKKAS
jgi:hypothetical protein